MYSKQESLKVVIGKTIRSVVFRSGYDASPESQLFLVFEDDTYFEFYGQEIGCVRSLSEGDMTRAIDYAKKFGSQVCVVNRNVSSGHE
jgi:hypothetical protein